MAWLTILGFACLTVLLVPAIADVAAWLRARNGVPTPLEPSRAALPRLLFLVPAHNEEALIGSCLQSLLMQDYPATQRDIVVIADHCTDSTVGMALAAGVRCMEYNLPHLPGKARALAWAIRQVAVGEYDAVVIVDADSVVNSEFAARLSSRAPLSGKAVQAYNGVRNAQMTALTRMADLLSEALYGLAYRLKQRAGLNVPLTGNGTCLGRALVQNGLPPALTACEDLELYVRLTTRGIPVGLAPDAEVYAYEAQSLKEARRQRRRWSAGRLAVLRRLGLPLLRSPLVTRWQKLDTVAELLGQGPAVHFGAVLAFSVAALLLRPPGGLLLTAALAGTLVRPATYAVWAIRRSPHPVLSLTAFAVFPLYAVWRLVIALSALADAGGQSWERSARPSAPLEDGKARLHED